MQNRLIKVSEVVIQQGMFDHLSSSASAGLGRIHRRLVDRLHYDLTLEDTKRNLRALVKAKQVCQTPKGLFCLPKNLEDAKKAEDSQIAPGEEPQDIELVFSSVTAQLSKKNRPVLRPTYWTGASASAGAGVCDSCSVQVDSREILAHTNWGTVRLCPKCCRIVMKRAIRKPGPGGVHFVSAPIGSGKHR